MPDHLADGVALEAVDGLVVQLLFVQQLDGAPEVVQVLVALAGQEPLARPQEQRRRHLRL